jgi:hypothetical protein
MAHSAAQMVRPVTTREESLDFIFRAYDKRHCHEQKKRWKPRLQIHGARLKKRAVHVNP